MANESPEFRKYKEKLLKLGADILPRVVAESINAVAMAAHEKSGQNVRSRFTLRNKYTERSLRYYKANPKADYKKINAKTGSISDYMDEQESGGYRKPVSGSKAPEATLTARGGKKTGVIRKKYHAGTLGSRQFMGTPRGRVDGKTRPYGVYERRNKNKKLEMIRKIEKSKIRIQARHWHSDAMRSARRGAVSAEFIKRAQAEIKKLQK